MYTGVRPWMTAALDVATSVEAVPQALFSRVLTVTRQTTHTVQTGCRRHRWHHAITPHAASRYVMLIESDITDMGPGVLS
jgi:hypothetical protein